MCVDEDDTRIALNALRLYCFLLFDAFENLNLCSFLLMIPDGTKVMCLAELKN